MNNYNSKGRGEKREWKGGDRNDRGGRSDFKKRDFGASKSYGDSKEMTFHKAVCADCKKTCEVPFRPNGEKPVFCRDCFGDKKDGGSRNERPSNTWDKKPYEKREGSVWQDRKASYGTPERAETSQSGDSAIVLAKLSEVTARLETLTVAMEKLSSALTKQVIAEKEMKVASSEVAKVKEESKKEVAEKEEVKAKKVVKKATPAKKAVAAKKVTTKKAK